MSRFDDDDRSLVSRTDMVEFPRLYHELYRACRIYRIYYCCYFIILLVNILIL